MVNPTEETAGGIGSGPSESQYHRSDTCHALIRIYTVAEVNAPSRGVGGDSIATGIDPSGTARSETPINQAEMYVPFLRYLHMYFANDIVINLRVIVYN